jgi:hypothetical protein
MAPHKPKITCGGSILPPTPPFGAWQFNTFITLHCLITLVHVSPQPSSAPSPSVYDSTEEAIRKMIEGIQKMISLHKKVEEETEGAEPPEIIMVNPATKKHCELQIKTVLQNAPIEMQLNWRELLKQRKDKGRMTKQCILKTCKD